MAEKEDTVRIVDQVMVLKQVQVYCCTPPFVNTPIAAGLTKVTLWSPKLISALISAKSEQWLAAALSSADFNHHVLAVVFTLSMIANCIYSILPVQDQIPELLSFKSEPFICGQCLNVFMFWVQLNEK